ncbi:antibiotic biosynthesis monooxygenase family protein [Pseudoalteromonas sp. S16_S37]|uniref:antibiotic biosynthesis monooxygenase family protein n=1 Tax=Pseudoalteromonas sp. S16_S37 TaxID=2720228 RepID=UPI0016818616|nr:hypothetical protein [Pseudoalteromonas sp. S16_S37]MBD1582852.1 hypothetical protein [Pseudoalteromonas sp. S16_S37]
MSQNVFEIVEFKLANGVSEADFLPLSDAFQKFLTQQPGFMYRSLATQQDNEGYVDISYWQSAQDLDNCEQAFNSSTVCKEFVALIDKDSIVMTRHAIIAQTSCNG